jgi:2'-5' RNA ligase
MAEPLRLFVAVTLPEDVRERLARWQDRLRGARADVSWVKPENIHLTVKFLGETDRKALARIQPALRDAAAQRSPFALELAGLGTFGGRVPRVVWAGVSDGVEPLADLAGRVDRALGRVGVAKERRPFSAHATLGRVRSSTNAEALVAAAEAGRSERFGRVPVEGFVLMQSRLDPRGSVYTAVERYDLGTPVAPA